MNKNKKLDNFIKKWKAAEIQLKAKNKISREQEKPIFFRSHIISHLVSNLTSQSIQSADRKGIIASGNVRKRIEFPAVLYMASSNQETPIHIHTAKPLSIRIDQSPDRCWKMFMSIELFIPFISVLDQALLMLINFFRIFWSIDHIVNIYQKALWAIEEKSVNPSFNGVLERSNDFRAHSRSISNFKANTHICSICNWKLSEQKLKFKWTLRIAPSAEPRLIELHSKNKGNKKFLMDRNIYYEWKIRSLYPNVLVKERKYLQK